MDCDNWEVDFYPKEDGDTEIIISLFDQNYHFIDELALTKSVFMDDEKLDKIKDIIMD